MPTLKAGVNKLRDNEETRAQFVALVREMRVKAEKEAKRIAEERRQAENTVHELRLRRRV